MDDVAPQVDAVVVGAGFAGLYMLHKLRSLGLSVRGFEAGSDVGGTWYWNRYPGCRCDVPSLEYSYSFDEKLQQEWNWTERYASQPEILAYANHVADRFGLRPHIRFDTRVVSAVFDEASLRWRVASDAGDRVEARFCIMATGVLSSTHMPEIPGIERFGGALYHTGNWPKEPVDFAGKRVALIGTGSSGIQAIPVIAEQAGHLYVFQRTAQFSIPARNRPLGADEVQRVKADYARFRAENFRQPGAVRRPGDVVPVLSVGPEEREAQLEKAWQEGGTNFLRAFSDLMETREKNEFAAGFARAKVRGIVKNPAVAEALLSDQVIGCKRICLDTNYFETYNRDNVTLVDIHDRPIEAITKRGLVANGIEYAVDCIVFATGFDALTGSMTRIDLRGRGGQTIQQKWAEGPSNYLGLALHGFPNLFMICGPGSPSVLANMVIHIEQQVDWIGACIAHLEHEGLVCIEAETGAERDWVEQVNRIAGGTLFPTCNSWYLGVNIPGKPRAFLPYAGGFHTYTDECDRIAARGYAGFRLS
jgi:cyclohexanone monooxygenase